MSRSVSIGYESRIGTRIKHTRLRRGFTLKEVAERIGCSISTLSKIENRRSNPSITMLHKICGALGTNMTTLFSDAIDHLSVVTDEADRSVITTDQLRRGHGIQLQRLVPYSNEYLLQGNIHVIEPRGYSDEGLEHEGEEVGYVVEGTLELTVNGKTYVARAGSSFYFRSDQPHSYRNIGDDVARVVWVNTPPTF